MFLLEVHAAPLDHHLRNLGRRSVVEIDQGLAVDGMVQHRKISSNTIDIPACCRCFCNTFYFIGWHHYPQTNLRSGVLMSRNEQISDQETKKYQTCQNNRR